MEIICKYISIFTFTRLELIGMCQGFWFFCADVESIMNDALPYHLKKISKLSNGSDINVLSFCYGIFII